MIIMTNLLQYCLLSPNVERIFAGEKSCPGGGADLLTVGLLQPHTSLGQSLHGAGRHVRVVPGHVVPSKVVGEDEDNIRLLFLASNQLGETAEDEAETPHRNETRQDYLCERDQRQFRSPDWSLCVTMALISHHTLGQAFVD